MRPSSHTTWTVPSASTAHTVPRVPGGTGQGSWHIAIKRTRSPTETCGERASSDMAVTVERVGEQKSAEKRTRRSGCGPWAYGCARVAVTIRGSAPHLSFAR